jgi:predicted DNA-binding mobile mystery protein A
MGGLRAGRDAAVVPARGWLRAVREATGITQAEIARRVGIKRQSYAQLEEAEQKEGISLGSLRRAAEAMDCDLVYYLVPKPGAGGSFAELAEARDPGTLHRKATEQSMALEPMPGKEDET